MGIDPSLTSTGYAYWKNGKLVTGRITTDKLRGPHRLFYVRLMVGKILDEVQPSLVVYEDYAMGARGNTFHMGELGGVLKTLLWERGIDVLDIGPTMLKSIIALSGSAKKPDIVAALKTRFGINVTQHDEADAVGLMLVGEMRCGQRSVTSESKKSRSKSSRFDSVRQANITRGKLKLVSSAAR